MFHICFEEISIRQFFAYLFKLVQIIAQFALPFLARMRIHLWNFGVYTCHVTNLNFRNVIIFGGSGFVGAHLIRDFLSEGVKVTVVDIQAPVDISSIHFIEKDIRRPIDLDSDCEYDLVVVLAATHRTPGHDSMEYYETNVLGALNIIEWCNRANLQSIWFLSSISVYGSAAIKSSEYCETKPTSDYGLSKLISEKMFLEWQSQRSHERRVVICRPSVIFGQGESGNMTRLAAGIKNGFFFLPSRKPILKSATYVKELYPSLRFVYDLEEPSCIFNLCFNKEFSLQDYAREICRLGRYRYPYTLSLEFFAKFQKTFTMLFGNTYIRFLKLFHPTNIEPTFLIENGYCFKYSLEDAFEDWWVESKFDDAK